MAKKYLDYDGLLYFWQKIKANFVTDVTYNSTSKKIQKTKAGSTSDVVTLSTVATSGSYNDLSNKPSIPSIPNNFGTVKVGSTNVAADTTSDTLELVAGTNISITPDATNDKVTIGFNGTIPTATTTTPKMDGTAAVGSETKFAKGDHVHPSDTSRVPTTRTVNGKALSANITLDATEIDVSQNTADSIQTATGIQVSTIDGAIAEIVDNLNTSAEVNQNAFSNVKVGSTTIAADSKTDTIELVAGSNVTLTPDATNDKVTIAATDTTYSVASTTANGLMSSEDKVKLNGIATGAEVNQNAFSNVKVGSTTVAADGKTDTLELVAGSNVTLTPDATNDKVTIAAANTTYSDFTPATSSAAGTHGLVPAPTAGMTATSVLTAEGFKPTSLTWGTKSGVTDIYLTLQFGEGTGAVGKAVKIPVVTSAQHGLMSSSMLSTLSSNANTCAAAETFMASKGQAGGLATLGSNGTIPTSQLPSYVDDVIEAYARSGQTALSQNWLATGSASGTVITPEAGKIYVLMADSGDYAANTQFRWGGTAYVKLSDGGVSSITNAEIDTIVAS